MAKEDYDSLEETASDIRSTDALSGERDAVQADGTATRSTAKVNPTWTMDTNQG
jgi:hypothetical protein